MGLKTTLDQWLTLFELEKAGSFQAAASKLHKSHTTLIYAIKKLENQLGVTLVQIQGRRAVLTDEGKSLLRRAAPMLTQAKELEVIGTQIAQGMESEISITIDHLCNREWLYGPLQEFIRSNKGISINIRETSLSSTTEAVLEEQSDIAIVTLPITNRLAEAFGVVTMIPVVSHSHPLALSSSVGIADLILETQIVISDLGSVGEEQKQDAGWLKSQQRITVDNFDQALKAIHLGLGYCRIPAHLLEEIDQSKVIRLHIEKGSCFQVPVHLVLPKEGRTGPAAILLYRLLFDSAKQRLM